MTRETLIRRIMAHEGFSGRPYLDTTGNLTIGYGRNLDARPLDETEGRWLLERDLSRLEARLESVPLYLSLDPVRRAALLEMAYNLGFRGLMGFERMLAALGRRDWEAAAREALDSRWARQVGRRADRIAHRLRTGEWESEAAS